MCIYLLHPGRGAEYCGSLCVCVSVCLSASISRDPLDRSSQNLVCRSPVAVASSSSGGVEIRYVPPVVWMMSRWALVGHMAICGKRRCDTGVESNVYECLVSS